MPQDNATENICQRFETDEVANKMLALLSHYSLWYHLMILQIYNPLQKELPTTEWLRSVSSSIRPLFHFSDVEIGNQMPTSYGT